ncbi:MAG: c-type cytochrome [Pseudomonadota bacterium]
MKRPALVSVLCLAASPALQAQDTYDPLEDYEPVASSGVLEAPKAVADTADAQAIVDQGAYLVELLGCGACHTDGALIGQPNYDRALAGSSVGIAFSNPLKDAFPSIVYPANLTPDKETGIGNWTEAQIKRAIQHGVDDEGNQQLPVMPWGAYRKLKESDVSAIASYLLSLEPVRHQVPDKVLRGKPSEGARYVHFGVYMSRDAAE